MPGAAASALVLRLRSRVAALGDAGEGRTSAAGVGLTGTRATTVVADGAPSDASTVVVSTLTEVSQVVAICHVSECTFNPCRPTAKIDVTVSTKVATMTAADCMKRRRLSLRRHARWAS